MTIDAAFGNSPGDGDTARLLAVLPSIAEIAYPDDMDLRHHLMRTFSEHIGCADHVVPEYLHLELTMLLERLREIVDLLAFHHIATPTAGDLIDAVDQLRATLPDRSDQPARRTIP